MRQLALVRRVARLDERRTHTGLVVGRQEHDNGLRHRNPRREHLTYVRRGFARRREQLLPVQRLQAQRPQELVHRVARRDVAAVYYEHRARRIGGRRGLHRRWLRWEVQLGRVSRRDLHRRNAPP